MTVAQKLWRLRGLAILVIMAMVLAACGAPAGAPAAEAPAGESAAPAEGEEAAAPATGRGAGGTANGSGAGASKGPGPAYPNGPYGSGP